MDRLRCWSDCAAQCNLFVFVAATLLPRIKCRVVVLVTPLDVAGAAAGG